MKDFEKIKDKFARFVGEKTPFQLKKLAIEGAIPGTFVEISLLRTYYLKDEDERVRNLAKKLLKETPSQEWIKFLDYFSNETFGILIEYKILPEDLVEEIISRGKLKSPELKAAVKNYGENQSLMELISRNQNAIVSDKELARLIVDNPATPPNIRDYICEITGIEVVAEPAIEEEPSVSLEEVLEEEIIEGTEVSEEKTPSEAVEVEQGEVIEEFEFEEEEEKTLDEKDITRIYKSVIGEQREDKKKGKEEPLHKKLLNMNMNEKIRLAEIGGEDVRSILIKDPNKLVALAVMRNPKLRDEEIVSIASSRTVIPEVLGFIASKRKWIKNYTVKLALVNNPKTPVPIAMKLIYHLMEKDLKNLKKNRNVSAAVINFAKKLLQQKEEKKRRSVVKKH